MNELEANLWEVPADLRVITTNGATKRDGACVMGRGMGRGCALEAKTRFPGIDQRLGDLLRRHGNRVMRLGRYGEGQVRVMIASFPVKHHWRQEADPALIRRSAEQLVALADKFEYARVVVPRPGCGNGRLSWNEVRTIVAEVLDERFTVVTFPKKKGGAKRGQARTGRPPEKVTQTPEVAQEDRTLHAIVAYTYDSPDDLGLGRCRRSIHEAGYVDLGAAGVEAFRLSTEVLGRRACFLRRRGVPREPRPRAHQSAQGTQPKAGGEADSVDGTRDIGMSASALALVLALDGARGLGPSANDGPKPEKEESRR